MSPLRHDVFNVLCNVNVMFCGCVTIVVPVNQLRCEHIMVNNIELNVEVSMRMDGVHAIKLL